MKINNSRETIHLGAEMEREILLITMEGKLHVIHRGHSIKKTPKQTNIPFINEWILHSFLFTDWNDVK